MKKIKFWQWCCTVTPSHIVQELGTTIILGFLSGRTRNLSTLIVPSLKSCVSFHSLTSSIFLREYLTLRISPTSSIASRACWMVTTSKSVPYATNVTDSREGSRGLHAWKETHVVLNSFTPCSPTPTMYTKWTGWYRIEKAVKAEFKEGNFALLQPRLQFDTWLVNNEIMPWADWW